MEEQLDSSDMEANKVSLPLQISQTVVWLLLKWTQVWFCLCVVYNDTSPYCFHSVFQKIPSHKHRNRIQPYLYMCRCWDKGMKHIHWYLDISKLYIEVMHINVCILSRIQKDVNWCKVVPTIVTVLTRQAVRTHAPVGADVIHTNGTVGARLS